MCHAVVQLRELTVIPAVGGSHQVAGDALQAVDILTPAARTLLHIRVGILVAAVHTTVAIVVHRAVAHIEAVHHVNDIHDYLRVVRGVAVDFHIEDMTAAAQLVIGGFHLCLMAG